jgi:hypothetical protein
MEIKKYLALFQSKNDYIKFMTSKEFVTPNVSVCDDTKEMFYNETTLEPFVITNAGKNQLTLSLKQNTTQKDLTYKVGDGEWQTAKSITIKQNESVSIVSSLEPISNYGIGTFVIDGDSTCKISGNIMSLYGNKNSIEDTYAFYKLFSGCTQLVDASNLDLPATTIVNYCYDSMFRGCTNLTTAPNILPATTLADNCYGNMFRGCESLTTAPQLPATKLANNCYQYMFLGCKNLTSALELPATTLTSNCYRDMFRNCSKLSKITMLATNISATNCLSNWVNGVSSSGTFVKHPLTSIDTGESGIPKKWETQYFVDSNKIPFISQTETTISLNFQFNTGTWSLNSNIIKLDNELSDEEIFSFSPESELIINIYEFNKETETISNIHKNIIWEVTSTLYDLLNTKGVNVESKSWAIFVINENETIGGNY